MGSKLVVRALEVHCTPATAGTKVRLRQLVTQTLRRYYEVARFYFLQTFGIHTMMGNSNIHAEDFSSVRLPAQDVTYPHLVPLPRALLLFNAT
jgi:hypothetical protein